MADIYYFKNFISTTVILIFIMCVIDKEWMILKELALKGDEYYLVGLLKRNTNALIFPIIFSLTLAAILTFLMGTVIGIALGIFCGVIFGAIFGHELDKK